MKENRIPFDIKYRQDIEAGRIFVGITIIAMAHYRRNYGDEYDWDDDNQHEEGEL